MNSIFKYTQYRKDFFENFLLKFSMFGEFNDPFEMIPGDFVFSLTEDEAKGFFSYSSSLNDPTYHLENVMDVQSGVRASLGVICFTTRQDNLLMWSHYGNNHEGICIEFDANADFFNGKYKGSSQGVFGEVASKDYYKNVGELKKVNYSKTRPLFIDPSELQDDTESWLTKSEDWEYEQEYRILLPVEHTVRYKEMLFYRVDKESIKSVIIGCQVSQATKIEIYSICSKLGIAVKESFINSAAYKLDIVGYHPDNHHSHINYYNLAKVTK